MKKFIAELISFGIQRQELGLGGFTNPKTFALYKIRLGEGTFLKTQHTKELLSAI